MTSEKSKKDFDNVIRMLDHTPHLSGKAVCLQCKHTWTAVAPIGTLGLECPECGLDKGVFNAICAPDCCWTCNCGCYHFFVSPDNIICSLCGIAQRFD